MCSINRDFKLAIVSRSPLKHVFPDQGNGSPAFNIIPTYTLRDMSEPEARELLAHPWAPRAAPLAVQTIEEILALAKGHPFLLQRAAYHAFEALHDTAHDWRTSWRTDREHLL